MFDCIVKLHTSGIDIDIQIRKNEDICMTWINRETRIVVENLIQNQEPHLSEYLSELDELMEDSETQMTADEAANELSGIIRDDLTNNLDFLGDGLYSKILSYALFERVNYHEIANWILSQTGSNTEVLM